MKRRVCAIISLFLVSVLLITGCSKTTSKEAGKGKRAQIKMFIVDKAEAPISTDMPIVKKIMEKCNVDLQFELAPSINSAERFNLVMASKDIPDVMVFKFDDLFKYTRAFEPLDDLINQYAPNVKAAIEADENMKKDLIAIDGKQYVIPMISAVSVSQVYFARKDWMEKLKIKQPETTEDFYQMLKAFKEKDPNGNGKADEIPFVTRSKKAGLMPFVEAFGVTEEFFMEDGKVKYGAADPRMKDALTYINKLYREGLIDTEYLTVDSKQWQAEVTNEQAGVLFDWLSRIDFFNQALAGSKSNGKFEAILPPVNGDTPRGISYQMRKARDDGAAAISRNSKVKKEIMEMYNYIFSDEGSILMNFGIEGENYDMVNNIPHHNDAMLKSPDGKSPQIKLWSYGINMDWPTKQDINHEIQFVSKEANEARELYDPFLKSPFPKLKFTDEERTEINAKLGDIKTFKDESIDKFITGADSLDNFDKYVSELKRIGLDRVLELYNVALDRYNKN